MNINPQELIRIVDGMGAAPLSPPHPDFVTAMGRTNDAIIYGGRTQLYVTGPSADAKGLADGILPWPERPRGGGAHDGNRRLLPSLVGCERASPDDRDPQQIKVVR